MLDRQRFERLFAQLLPLVSQPWLEALEEKQRLFARGDDLESMLSCVFTAKRRLKVSDLPAILKNEFSTDDRKARGAALDFAAEWRHFRDPVAVPLETRWALDALRELGGEGADPRQARAWLYERLRGEGIYRDQHWWADLALGFAYVEYLRAMTGGVLGSDFTRAMQPDEQLAKLLGLRVHAYS